MSPEWRWRAGLLLALCCGAWGMGCGPAERRDEQQIAALVRQLETGTAQDRWQAAEQLTIIGPPATAVPALVAALADSDAYLPQAAANALGAIGPHAAAAVPALTELLGSHRIPTVRMAAAGALGRIDRASRDRALRYLLAVLGDPQVSGKANAATYLGYFREEAIQVVPALATALEDPDESVRQNARGALQRLGTAGARAALAGARREPDESRSVEVQRLGVPFPWTAAGTEELTIDGLPWLGAIPLEGWRYQVGDDPGWARSDLVDSTWTPVSPTYWIKSVGQVRWAAPGVLPHDGWRGLAWFRLHLVIEPILAGTPLLLSLPVQPGAAEVFLDGQQVYAAGRPGASTAAESVAGERLPRTLLVGSGEHVLAVRYSNLTVPSGRYGGFALQLDPADQGLAEAAQTAATRTRALVQQAAFTAVPLVVCLLHLVLFLFYRRARENLYYAGFTLLVALAVYATYQSNLPPLIVPQAEWNKVPGFTAPPWALGLLPLGLLLLYRLLLPQLPKRFWFFAGAYGISALLSSGLVGEWSELSLTGSELAAPLLVILSSFVVWALLPWRAHRHPFVSIPACATLALLAGGAVGWWRAPDHGIEAVVTGALGIVLAAQLVVVLLTLLELVRVPGAAVIRRQEGAWMIVVGILGIIAAPAASATLGAPSLALGLMSPVVAISAFLARRTARTSRDLEVQLTRVQELSAQTVEQERALREEAEKELRTAHELQMGLLPQGSPAIEGCSSAGRCLPAAQVGGDLFQYYHSPGRLSVALADVTGHAMQAAIPAVMFSGILDSQMRTGGELGAVFGRLNEVLCGKLTGRTHVTLAMAELEVRTGVLRFANAGCPYPCHWRSATGEVVELSLDAYPLGVKLEALYRTVEARLAPGDYLVFYSDGIAEAQDPAGELFGFERTVGAIQEACRQDLSPEGVIDHLVAAVRGFCGETAQADDITCVVVGREG